MMVSCLENCGFSHEQSHKDGFVVQAICGCSWTTSTLAFPLNLSPEKYTNYMNLNQPSVLEDLKGSDVPITNIG